MPRDYKLFLEDILESISHVRDFTKGMSEATFKNDKKTQYAVLRCLEIMGEATINVPERIRDRYPQIPWRKIRSFRNISTHHYWEIDVGIAWDISHKFLDDLEQEIQRTLNDMNTCE